MAMMDNTVEHDLEGLSDNGDEHDSEGMSDKDNNGDDNDNDNDPEGNLFSLKRKASESESFTKTEDMQVGNHPSFPIKKRLSQKPIDYLLREQFEVTNLMGTDPPMFKIRCRHCDDYTKELQRYNATKCRKHAIDNCKGIKAEMKEHLFARSQMGKKARKISSLASTFAMSMGPGNTDDIHDAPTAMSKMHPSAVITMEAAEKAMEEAAAVAISNHFKVTICIVDSGGIPLLVKRLDGAFPASYDIALGKARTAAAFRKETRVLESTMNVTDGNGRTSMLSVGNGYVMMGGGVPIENLSTGTCLGAVGVSGVKPDEDELVARAAASFLSSAPIEKVYDRVLM